jgi:biopolymer transport protein TolR
VANPDVKERADINVTPLIDVMLVLLIIFMVVTPVTQRSLDTSIPEAPREQRQSPGGLVLSVDREGVQLDGLRVPMESLEAHCRERFAIRDDKTLFVKAEGDVPYGVVVAAMDAAKGGGVQRIGIITPKRVDKEAP